MSADMRKILEQVSRALEGSSSSSSSSSSNEMTSVHGLKNALDDAIMNNTNNTQLQQDLYRAIHPVLDKHYPGWDYDG